MSAVERHLADAGTAESAWRARGRLLQIPPLVLPRAARVVVVAPHPDDEILGCAGLLRAFHRHEANISVVAVTDGEASHPKSPTVTADALAGRRAQETAVAFDRLGLASVAREALHLPDGKVNEHEAELAARLAPLTGPDCICVAPWEHDGHPDHDAAGRVAANAASRVGATLLGYLVWTWHWAQPGDSAVPWERARRVRLTTRDYEAKRSAIDAFESQITPLSAAPGDDAILDAGELAHHGRRFEVFLI